MKITQKGFLKLTKNTLTSLLILTTLFFGTGLIYLFGPWTKKTEAVWFNDDWGYRQEVPVTSTNGSAQSNVFLSFSLDTATLITAGKLQSSCQDIRVTDFSGNILPYHIGRTNACNNAATTIDFLVSSFPDLKSTYYVYYGNPSVPSKDAGAFSQSQASNYSVGSLGTEAKAEAPVGYWRFDEGTGTTANNSTTTASINGTLAGATTPSWQSEDQCISFKCLYFNGTTANITVATAINGIQTISLWVRPNSVSSSALIDLDGGTHKITISSGTISATGFTSPTIYVNGVVSSTLSANTWQFVSVTTGTSFNSTSSLTIGKSSTTFFQGFMDEVKVYNYARSSAQVQADYNARSNNEGASGVLGASNNQPAALSNGLVGYWKMDETSGNASDSSGNGTTLTNNNTTAFAVGKFGNAGSFTAASLHYFSTASTISGIKTVSFWVNPSATTDDFVNLTASAYVSASSGTVSATGFTSPSIYVNGVLNGTITASTWNHIVVTTDTEINANAFEAGRANSSYLNGSLDEGRVYNRALSAADVSTLYNFAPGPVGWWKMEDKVTGNSQTLVDSSGNGNSGTTSWGANAANMNCQVSGKYGGGCQLDGTDDKITASYINPGASYSFSFWIYPKDTSTTQLVLWDGPADGNNNTATMNVFISGGNISFRPSNGTTYATISTSLTASVWTHFSGNNNGTTLNLYKNGVLVTPVSAAGAVYTTGGATFRIGVDGSDTYPLNASIDEVKIYNYIRTTGQVVEDMNAGHPAPGSPVGSAVAWYRFEQGADNMCTGGTNDVCNSGNAGSALNGFQTNMATPATSTSGWTQKGRVGRALIFDGTTGDCTGVCNDIINSGSDTSIDNLTANPMAISGWIYPNTMGESSQGVIVAKNSGATPSSGWLLQTVATNTIKFSVDGTTDLVVTAADNSITPGAWNHIALSWDGVFTTASSVHIYVNGAEVSYQTQTNGVTRTSDAASSLFIGNDSSGASTFDGTIDELKLYNLSLTRDQIAIDKNQSSSQVLGALGDNSGSQRQSVSQEYCIPGDSSTCTEPVARWDFEEGTSNQARDLSGNGATATVSNASYVSGHFGKAISFNGTTSQVSPLTATAIANLPTTGMTLESWIKPETIGEGTGGMILYKATNADPDNGWILQLIGTNAIQFIQDYATTDIKRISANNSITLNSWNHVVMTWTGGTTYSTIHIYVNGKEVTYNDGSSADSSGAIVPDNSTTLYIGNNSTTANTFKGLIDNITMYNYVKTPSQIAWDYNKGEPVAYWRLDDCQGTTAIDSSGNGNTGTWNGISGGTQTSAGTCTTVDTATAWYNGRTGKRNYSLNFDGTDDYISVADNALLQLSNSLSFSMWFKYTTTSEVVPFRKDTETGTRYIYGFYLGRSVNGKVVVSAQYFNGSTFFADSDISVNDNAWHQAVGVISGTALNLYVDGKLHDSVTISGTQGAPTGQLNIGAAPPNTLGGRSQYFPGQLDDVRIYNYPLTATQVKTLYNNGAVNFAPSSGAP